MDGAAGPSGLDAAAWKHLCTSFKKASSDLCDSLASIAAMSMQVGYQLLSLAVSLHWTITLEYGQLALVRWFDASLARQ